MAKKGQTQKRAYAYERKKARDHRAKHIGGPGKPDATKGKQKIEIKDKKSPVTKPELVKLKRKGVTKVISKAGFTDPALGYGKKVKMKLYRGKKKLTP